MSYSEPPPPPQYGAPLPPQGGMPPRRSGLSVASLVLGIIGVIPCFWGCLVFGVLAIVFGQLGKKDVRDSGGAKTGAELAKWGLILGIASIVLGVIYWILALAGVFPEFDYTTD